jgi:hypothetical protein
VDGGGVDKARITVAFRLLRQRDQLKSNPPKCLAFSTCFSKRVEATLRHLSLSKTHTTPFTFSEWEFDCLWVVHAIVVVVVAGYVVSTYYIL